MNPLLTYYHTTTDTSSLPLVANLEFLRPRSVLLHEDSEPIGVVSVAHDGGADVPGLAIRMNDVELVLERLALGIGSTRADGQLALRIRVVKRDGLGDGIVGIEAVIVRLAVEVGIELDGLVVRRPADSVLDVGDGSVGGIFHVGDPGSPDQPCNRREWFDSGRWGSGLRLCDSAGGENSKPEKQCKGQESLRQ